MRRPVVHFRAFEAEPMPEDTCAARLAELSELAKALELRISEIAALADAEPLQRTSAADLDVLPRRAEAALENSSPTRIKTLLQALADEIRVYARDTIEPIFRVPAVRPPSR